MGDPGLVTIVQRGDSLRLTPHFHTLALDGVYVKDEAGELHFRALGDPTPEDIAQVAAWITAPLYRDSFAARARISVGILTATLRSSSGS